MSTQAGVVRHSSPPTGHDYPLEKEVYLAPGKDRSFYRQILYQDPTRLFESDRIFCEVMRFIENSGSESASMNLSTQQICSLDEFDGVSFSPSTPGEHVFYLIHQIFSWGQLQITQDVFQGLLAHRGVFAPFLHVVHEFGSRTQDKTPSHNVFHSHKHGYLDNNDPPLALSHHDHGK